MRPGRLKFIKPAILILLLIVGVLIPFVIESTFIVHLLILSFVWAMMAGGYNLLMGYTGLLSLGHAAFYAIGAYTSVILVKNLGIPWPLGMICAGVTAGIIAFLMGFLVLRLRGVYFAMVTFGFAEIIRLIIENWESMTGGVYGIIKVPPMFADVRFTYVFVMLLMVLVYFILYRIIHSHIGRAFIAIREDEDVAKSVGINVARYKTLSFVISAFIAGIAGSVMAHYFRYVYPDWAHFLKSADLLVYTVVGGSGSFIGPGLAATFFVLLPEFSRTIGHYQILIYGVILVLVIIFIPQGLEPIFRSLYNGLRNRIKRGRQAR